MHPGESTLTSRIAAPKPFIEFIAKLGRTPAVILARLCSSVQAPLKLVRLGLTAEADENNLTLGACWRGILGIRSATKIKSQHSAESRTTRRRPYDDVRFRGFNRRRLCMKVCYCRSIWCMPMSFTGKRLAAKGLFGFVWRHGLSLNVISDPKLGARRCISCSLGGVTKAFNGICRLGLYCTGSLGEFHIEVKYDKPCWQPYLLMLLHPICKLSSSFSTMRRVYVRDDMEAF
jgi:hypothetical protein